MCRRREYPALRSLWVLHDFITIFYRWNIIIIIRRRNKLLLLFILIHYVCMWTEIALQTICLPSYVRANHCHRVRGRAVQETAGNSPRALFVRGTFSAHNLIAPHKLRAAPSEITIIIFVDLYNKLQYLRERTCVSFVANHASLFTIWHSALSLL